MAEELKPGDNVSYQLCKVILTHHPLGQKIAEGPVKLAQSQEREIEIPGAPDEVKEEFIKQWIKDGANKRIRNFVKTSRAYGIASIALLQEGVETSTPIDFTTLWNKGISFNVFDPLNTAGSLVLNQDPNAMDFQKYDDIRVSDKTYHRSRCVVLMNEEPVYIEYTTSAFGFVGRSCYQRAIFPLKTFIQTMITDDLVVIKVGVLVAKLKQVTSAVNQAVANLFGSKRQVLKEAVTGNVISVGVDEFIESLNLQNLDAPYTLARNNVLKNIATAIDAPAKFMDQETMVEGFGEGTEDAKNMARFVDGIREDMQPAYDWFDKIEQYRAWNPNFFKEMQAKYPELYGGKDYKQVFYEWRAAFKATWPNLLMEPDSEKAKADDVKLKAIISALEVFLPELDPENKAKMLEWAMDNFNAIKQLFPMPLDIEMDKLQAFLEENASKMAEQMAGGEGDEKEPPPPPTESGRA